MPSDLKKMDINQLDNLAAEIRKMLLENIPVTGGHLAPNLGVVELTIALHYVLDIPRDKIVWDVGHQTYVHKILTGRGDKIGTIRKKDGISGFPKPHESEYDSFGTGHSSTSISAALGMAAARDLNGEDYKIAAVIGDGSLTGGLAFEGLNNCGIHKTAYFNYFKRQSNVHLPQCRGIGPLFFKAAFQQIILDYKSCCKKAFVQNPCCGKVLSALCRTLKSHYQGNFCAKCAV